MSSEKFSHALPRELTQDIVKYRHICVLTGAGISAESGLATFRGKDGLWAKFRPEELASLDAFMRNSELVWEWYQHRRQVLRASKASAGHLALAVWEQLASEFTLVTQNVDGLHQLAGSRNVIELHGNLQVNRCLNCGSESTDVEITFSERVPHCHCGGKFRPGVVWFGEMLPEANLERAMTAAENCDLFLSVGTSSQVYPAAALPAIALDHGAILIEINPEVTSLTPLAHYHLQGEAGAYLRLLVSAYESKIAHDHS